MAKENDKTIAISATEWTALEEFVCAFCTARAKGREVGGSVSEERCITLEAGNSITIELQKH